MLCIMTSNTEKARKYLEGAYKIFEAKGMEKQKKEVEANMNSIYSPSSDLFEEETKPAIKIRKKKKVLKP